MSDTSDFTVVDGSDPTTLPPDSAPESTAAPATFPLMGPMVDEALEIADAIRQSIRAAYDVSLPPATELQSPGQDDKIKAYEAAKSLVGVMRQFQGVMLNMDREGFTVTAGLFADDVIEAAQALSAAEAKKGHMTDDDAHVVLKVVMCRYRSHAVKCARESQRPAQAGALCKVKVWGFLEEAVYIIWSERLSSSQAVANIHATLLPKYVSACASHPNFANYLSGQYIEYAESVLATLDQGGGADSGRVDRLRQWCTSFRQ